MKAPAFRPIMTACLAASLLAGCGLFGGGDERKEIIFNDVLGPETKSQIKPLPKTLTGDKENQRHSRDSQAPQDMDPKG